MSEQGDGQANLHFGQAVVVDFSYDERIFDEAARFPAGGCLVCGCAAHVLGSDRRCFWDSCWCVWHPSCWQADECEAAEYHILGNAVGDESTYEEIADVPSLVCGRFCG